MGVNRPREDRQNQRPDVEQQPETQQPDKQERNPITDPPQGENQEQADNEGRD